MGMNSRLALRHLNNSVEQYQQSRAGKPAFCAQASQLRQVLFHACYDGAALYARATTKRPRTDAIIELSNAFLQAHPSTHAFEINGVDCPSLTVAQAVAMRSIFAVHAALRANPKAVLQRRDKPAHLHQRAAMGAECLRQVEEELRLCNPEDAFDDRLQLIVLPDMGWRAANWLRQHNHRGEELAPRSPSPESQAAQDASIALAQAAIRAASEDAASCALEGEFDAPIPQHFECPLTLTLLRDPVLSPSGHSYERQAIEEWLTGQEFCPLTRVALRKEQLYANRHLKHAIERWVSSHRQGAVDDGRCETSSGSLVTAQEAFDEVVPPEYICPIGGDVMTIPVLAPSGHTFERSHLVRWLALEGRDPITQQALQPSEVYNNRALQEELEGWALRHRRSAVALPVPEEQIHALFDDLNHPGFDAPVPQEFLCDLTGNLLQQPVITPAGFVYELEAIASHLALQPLCPRRGEPLHAQELRPEPVLHALISAWVQQHRRTTPPPQILESDEFSHATNSASFSSAAENTGWSLPKSSQSAQAELLPPQALVGLHPPSAAASGDAAAFDALAPDRFDRYDIFDDSNPWA